MSRSLREQLARISKTVNSSAKEILNTTVADAVIEMGIDNVEKVVYNAYDPKSYERTYQLQYDAWKSIPVECGVIIRNDRIDGNRQVSHIVESGYGYHTPLLEGFSRPFMQVTREQVQNSNVVEDILRKELSGKLGVKVR